MNQGQVVAIRNYGLWQWATYVGRKGKGFEFKVGNKRVTVNHWDIEFPRYEDDE